MIRLWGRRSRWRPRLRTRASGESAATTLRYYSSTDATITTSDTALGTDSVGSLAAAGTSDQSIELTAPSTAGTYYYGACVAAVSDESDTNNNCSSALALTIGAPDLVVSTPTVDSTSQTVGGSFTLNATVRNQGSSGAVASTLRYYRSADTTITTSDTALGTDSISALAAFGTSDQSIDLTAPSDAGTYYYGACADAVYRRVQRHQQLLQRSDRNCGGGDLHGSRPGGERVPD